MKLKNLSDFVNKYKNQKNINIFLRCDLNITENDLSRIDMSIPTINKLLNQECTIDQIILSTIDH